MTMCLVISTALISWDDYHYKTQFHKYIHIAPQKILCNIKITYSLLQKIRKTINLLFLQILQQQCL